MIKIDNLKVYGIEEAIRGMRNPKNSWDRSDSDYRPILASKCDDCELFKKCEFDACNECETHKILTSNPDGYLVGPNDLDLMKRLARGGPVHAKYRRYITVYVDINAPLYFWKEFDTYRVGVCPNPSDIEMNSCSTMHTVHKKPFELDDFSHEHMHDLNILKATIQHLNKYRDIFIETNDKDCWWQLIQNLPSSYMQMRTVKLNYEVLANMYEFRHNHKLDEWVELMQFFKDNCPCSEVFTTNPNIAHIEARNELIKKLCNDIYNRLELCNSPNLFDKIVISPEELKTLLSAAAKKYIYEKE